MHIIGMVMKVAIPTNGKKGLNDHVSNVFGRSPTFTIIDIEDGEIKKVEVIENPASSYPYGAGPIVVKTLIDMNINAIITCRIGPSISAILKSKKIPIFKVPRGLNVKKAIEAFLTWEKLWKS